MLYLERENGTVSSEDPGGWIGYNNGLRLNFISSLGLKCFHTVLYPPET